MSLSPYYERFNARGVSPGTDGPDMEDETCSDCENPVMCEWCGCCNDCCKCRDEDEDDET